MKTIPLLLIIITCLPACKQKTTVAGINKEPDYQKGESFLYKQNDSAFFYFNKVVNTSRDSLQIAMAYNNMAAIQSDAGDDFGSQEYLLQSLKYLNEHNTREYFCLASDYNELGTTSLHLKNYDAAIEYYDQAIQFIQDDAYRLVTLNNKALAYQKKKDYSQAIIIYDSIISIKQQDRKAYARVLSNLARTKWLQNPSYQAAPELQSALQIRLKENDQYGQNASYAHLSDYYAATHPDSALFYANKMYATSRLLNNPDDETEALQKLITLNTSSGNHQYFSRYQYLTDSIQTAHNTAKNQFALIRYEAQKNKAEKLTLQKENADKKVQIIQQQLFLYIILFAVLTGGTFLIFWYRRRKQKMAWESEKQIRDHKLMMSQKVHDVVANGLYRIMATIQHSPGIDKEELLDDIEVMYEKSRDISYEHTDTGQKNFQQEISSLLTSFATDSTRVTIAGNSSEIWQQVSPAAKNEVKHILQELMVNMKKHSGAGNVVVRFEQQSNHINIRYTDNGVGLSETHIKGNGLTNTGNRIKSIKGNITFESNTPKGLKAQISFPIV